MAARQRDAAQKEADARHRAQRLHGADAGGLGSRGAGRARRDRRRAARQGVGDARQDARRPTRGGSRGARRARQDVHLAGPVNEEGIAELERAVALREQGPGRDSVSQATSLQALARAHRDAGDFEQALSLYQRAAAILDAKGDDALGERAMAHYEIGRTLGQASRFPEGERSSTARRSCSTGCRSEELGTRGLVLSERADFARVLDQRPGLRRAPLDRGARSLLAGTASRSSSPTRWGTWR